MMGSGRTNEKDKPPPASANPLTQANNDYANGVAQNIHSSSGVTFQEGNVSGGFFETVPDMTWENIYSINQSITQGIPETSGNPRDYFMNHNGFQNPQYNLSSNTGNMVPPEVSLLPELNMGWNPQFINQGRNSISADGMNIGDGIINFENPWSDKNLTIARNFTGDIQMSRQGGESTFAAFNRPQVNTNIAGRSPLHYHPRDTAPVHTRNNVNFITSQCGVQGKAEGSFLSLGIGGIEEAIPNSRSGSREISDKLREAASAELRMARARKAMGQTSDATFMGSQRNTGSLSNQLGHVDRMNSTNNDVGVHCALNGGPGSSSHYMSMQQRHGDLDYCRAFVSDQATHSGMLGGNSAQAFNSQQYDLNRLASESTLSGQLQNIRFKNANSLPSECSMDSPSLGLGSCSTRQNFAGQRLRLQNGMPTQGLGGSPFPQRIAAPQVAWVSSGQAATDAPFPKRLGVEVNGRDSPQSAERCLSPMGTSLQTASTGQICQFPDKGSTCLTDHLFRPSIGQSDRTDGALVNYPLTSQEPFLAHGQSQNVPIQLPKDPRKAVSTNASTVVGLSQKPDFHVRPYHKRTAVAPPPAPHWVQRQKITHPTIHHSMPIPFPTRPPISAITALGNPSMPVASQTQPAGPLAAPINPSIPCTSNFRPRIPVAASSVVSHIKRKDPDTRTTPPLTGYKCLLCKRDLSLTSEGAVYQPTVPPAVAVLPCGHTFHDQCLHNITPQDQSKDPPCIPCALGEN